MVCRAATQGKTAMTWVLHGCCGIKHGRGSSRHPGDVTAAVVVLPVKNLTWWLWYGWYKLGTYRSSVGPTP